MNQQRAETQTSYDRIADEYARQIYGELAGKPLDRAILDRFAERLRGRGVVCDMGCGPGQIGRYLADRGLLVVGVDLSPGMVAQAAALNPDVAFRVGDMTALDEPDGAWAGIAAFYSIIHVPPGEIVAALTEMRRVLQPDGLLLLAFHTGDEVVRSEELMGQAVALDFWFYTPEQMRRWLGEAGYGVEEIIEREPYAPDVEHQSRRAYVLARKL
jgi:SAM-dependent methyltransferase